MTRHFNWDSVVASASWLIVAVLIYGVFFILTGTFNPANPIVHVLGDLGTRATLVTLYASEASLLAYAKLKKKNTLRKRVLLCIYLTGFFLGILGFVLNGFTQRLIANLVLSSCAAVCWLYWKFKTDYLDVGEFYSGPLPPRERS